MPKTAEKPLIRSPIWRRVLLVATAGILFGFGIAISFGPVHQPTQRVQQWVQVSDDTRSQPAPAITRDEPESLRQVAAKGPEVAEMEKLKVRNRRLEALVEVLKKRSHQKAQP